MGVDLDRGHERRLAHEVSLLRSTFSGSVPGEILDRTIRLTVAEFEDARIKEFVPVLVHRTVREELRDYLVPSPRSS